MKKWILVLLALASFQSAWADKVKDVDSVIAVVAGRPVTLKEWKDLMQVIKQQEPKISENDLKKNALNQLIDKNLILQVAKRNGVKASSAEIDEALNNIAANQKTTVKSIYEQMQKIGVGQEQLRRVIADNIMVDKTTQNALGQQKVNPDELLQELNSGRYTLTGKVGYVKSYLTQHILIKTDKGQNSENVEQRLTEIARALRAGESFENMAAAYSQDTSAKNGGSIGWVNDGETVPEFEKAMKSLKVGQISDPIRSPFGWHIIRVKEIRETETKDLETRQAAYQAVLARKTEQAREKWLNELRQAAYIEIRDKTALSI